MPEFAFFEGGPGRMTRKAVYGGAGRVLSSPARSGQRRLDIGFQQQQTLVHAGLASRRDTHKITCLIGLKAWFPRGSELPAPRIEIRQFGRKLLSNTGLPIGAAAGRSPPLLFTAYPSRAFLTGGIDNMFGPTRVILRGRESGHSAGVGHPLGPDSLSAEEHSN